MDAHRAGRQKQPLDDQNFSNSSLCWRAGGVDPKPGLIQKITPPPPLAETDGLVLTWESVLGGAHAVGALDGAAQVEHGEHGDDHHHTLEQQGEFKLLAHPAGISPQEKMQVDVQKFNE